MTYTGKLVHEETPEDMDERFSSGGFSEAGGNLQSMAFSFKAALHLSNLPIFNEMMKIRIDTERDQVRGAVFALHDYGCAEGDGTAVLQLAFPMAKIKGLDFSPKAVERASARWPTIPFEVGNILEPSEPCDVLWASHVIEHMEDPAAVCRNLLRFCRIAVILVPPITAGDEGENHGGHIGAIPFAEWRLLLDDVVAAEAKFTTSRLDRYNNNMLNEGTNIMVLTKNGELP